MQMVKMDLQEILDTLKYHNNMVIIRKKSIKLAKSRLPVSVRKKLYTKLNERLRRNATNEEKKNAETDAGLLNEILVDKLI